MKILVYGINYAPELTGIGKYTAEMAETLAEQGHAVRVVCAPPYYPEWRIASGYAALRYSTEQRRGVALWRAPLWVPSRPSGVRRIVHLASFALSSLPLMLRQALWRPDVVICIAPSLLNAPAGWLVARMTGAHAWIHIQDYEVDAAFNLGMLKGSLLKRMVLALERGLLKRFDTVSTISGKMIEHAARKGVDTRRLVHFANWADTHSIYPLKRPSELRATLSISSNATVVLYSGNMGAKQGLDVLAEAAQRLVSRDNLVFVFCGNGPARDDLIARCGGLGNCRFMELQPVSRLNELLNLADIHVLPQRADAADLVMPSKLTGMFASGRAVIAMASPGTELHDVVARRGVVVPPGDPDALASAIDALAADGGERARLGEAGRTFAEAVLSRDAVLTEFDTRLRALRLPRSSTNVSGAQHPDF
ncbi:glycosyltransferase WbuB [Burkholderia multivorans]|uniref:glycosyltransferase WbuB n=1 Tax=Burkholderia multivorans TaxID=87883 RepID=UPI000CFFFB73|nr:glycosyltransferase WbuB [Burkholderia multivorans]MBU9296690.1 glycosyltransferase WbuB [Burkholderia multivorans]PRH32664.1 colanic acid biosynthesis glycosyltransferase WcaI [Burkholderia multivorans]